MKQTEKKQGSGAKSDPLDQGACVYGAGVLLKHVDALREEVSGVQAGEEDIEFIHRARVASRRLRAAMPLFQDCLPARKSALWLKQVRGVTRALGEARDLDVQLERLAKFYGELAETRFQPGVRRLMLRLQQKRQKLQAPLTAAMSELIAGGVIEAMHDLFAAKAARAETVYMYTPRLYQHSFQSISLRLDDFLSYSDIVAQPEKVTELHEMRITAKWLRYTMENFAPLYSNELKPYLQAIRQAQDMLGDIHDADVWKAFLPMFVEKERQRAVDYYGHDRPFRRMISGIRCFEQDRKQARDETYRDFVNKWQAWQQESLWESLRATIQVPFPQPATIYPPLSPAEPAGDEGQDALPQDPAA